MAKQADASRQGWDNPHDGIEARFVAVLKDRRYGRGLQLIKNRSRAIRLNEIHELIATDQPDAGAGAEVMDVSYIGFVEFTKPGMLIEGDQVEINGEVIGEIAGVDETHMPNHQNIVIRKAKQIPGLQRGYKLGDVVRFIPVFSPR